MSRLFRETFDFGLITKTHYFPRHMQHGLTQMQRKLTQVDAILEVHDARLPFSGRNPMFKDVVAIKPTITVFNKKDLTDSRLIKPLVEKLERSGVKRVLFTDCKQKASYSVRKLIMPAIKDTLKNADRFNRSGFQDYNLLVIGVPNVGKSTIINALRSNELKRFKGKATRVGGVAGVTRTVLEKIRISDVPPIFMFDTPGVLNSKISSVEEGIKLALCATIEDHRVGPEVLVDYLLYQLNKQRKFKYVGYFDLEEPVDDVMQLLIKVAVKFDLIVKAKSVSSPQLAYRPDTYSASNKILHAFRNGMLGGINLDHDLLKDDEYLSSIQTSV